ncbi:membrane protein [Sorangium cellulosum]|uniref:Membrane protein n=1 Tax=Sorangium cellulosum TaxID=56 RepID=A0A2L0EVW6_SORCE|nr:hypothetical protein [Sorangium cellulosum]AUX43422.1 membrane protein [Sorangium cellulosum]
MSFINSPRFLRRALLADAVVSGATGLLMLAGAAPLAGLVGLPEALLRGAGASLLPFAALVAWLGTRARPGRTAVLAVVAVNALWVIDSVLLLALGWFDPTALGVTFVAAQALIVAAFAEAQVIGLRRAQAQLSA